jgi:hypothetical protein
MIDLEAGQTETLPSSSIFRAFDVLIQSYKDVISKDNTFLGKISAGAKYTLLFTTFADKYKGDIKKDERGQYARVGNAKIRPLNAKGQAFFFQAVSYRME